MPEDVHSTGRGGAGNIGTETKPTSYVDAAIVREGIYGESNGENYSAGRGGAGNIGQSPSVRPVDHNARSRDGTPARDVPAAPLGARADAEYVPETSMRNTGMAPGKFHTGRGGAGNEQRVGAQGKAPGEKEGLVQKVEDKVKGLLHKDGKNGQ